MLRGAAQRVEQRGFSAVGIAYQRHVYGAVFVAHYLFGLFVHLKGAGALQAFELGGVVDLHHFYHAGLGRAQAHLVVHHSVFDGIAQRGMQQHAHGASLYKSHFHDALTESAVAEYLHDHSYIACLEF